MAAAGAGDALVHNDNLVLDAASVADLRAGLIDPRIVAVLATLSREHTITVSGMRSGHGRFTSTGQLSSHQFGRGVDITAIDGMPVAASNLHAREIAARLQELDASIRPDEVGTPWAISGPGYYTDASHQSHVHIGFSRERGDDWEPPATAEPPPQVVGDARALLDDPRVVLRPSCDEDLRAGRVDPRIVALLTALSRDHTITVSSLCSGHARFTAGGSLSSHHHGRAADIAAIDGEPVNASNATARRVALALQDLDPAIRPDEIATPWAIAGPGYWTDATHQSHLHVGFARPLASGWKPPEAAPPEPPPAAVAPAAASRGRVPGARALAAVVEAEKHLGAPYHPGGSTPETGFDPSGLVQWSYAQAGIHLPRVASEQMAAGAPVERADLLPGDLVFSGDGRVGIALGGERLVHVGEVVERAGLGGRLSTARRVDPAGSSAAPEPTEIARAQALVARDAAEVRRRGSRLFAAVEAQEGKPPLTWLDPLSPGP
jgi:cell wall-associated NlpC family hydrolase